MTNFSEVITFSYWKKIFISDFMFTEFREKWTSGWTSLKWNFPNEKFVFQKNAETHGPKWSSRSWMKKFRRKNIWNIISDSTRGGRWPKKFLPHRCNICRNRNLLTGPGKVYGNGVELKMLKNRENSAQERREKTSAKNPFIRIRIFAFHFWKKISEKKRHSFSHFWHASFLKLLRRTKICVR